MAVLLSRKSRWFVACVKPANIGNASHSSTKAETPIWVIRFASCSSLAIRLCLSVDSSIPAVALMRTSRLTCFAFDNAAVKQSRPPSE